MSFHTSLFTSRLQWTMALRVRSALPYRLSLTTNNRNHQNHLHPLSQQVHKMSTITIPPPEKIMKPMDFPRKLLMGPGPSNCPPEVLAAGALPLLGHMHPEFFDIMDEVKEGIQYLFQTKNEWTFLIPGSGHAAMEACATNLLEPGDTALVNENGLWGQKFADMVDRNGGCDIKSLTKPMGEVFSLDEMEQALKEYKPSVLFVTFGESSTGAAQPLEGLGDLCHKYNCLLAVDSVAAMGGLPLFMDDWGIDVLYSGSQKVLSVPPGVSPISFSQRARDKIANRKTRVRSYYLDAAELANYWGCDENPRRYHHTAPVSIVFGLREGIARVVKEGLEKSWENHKACAQLLYDGVEKMGLELLVKDKNLRNPCVTTIKVPEGINWKVVADYAMDKHRVELSGGLSALAGKVWRIGIMGYNCKPENIHRTLTALGEGVEYARK